jgi:AraC-like DNA-binding protein
VRALRQIAGRDIRATRAVFAEVRTTSVRDFERFYGCSVEFNAPSDQLVFPSGMLALPLVTEDYFLLKTLRPICDAAAKERGTRAGTVRAAVENELPKLLPQGKARMSVVAKALGFSARTLHRRLADEGTTFAKVVDELKRSLAAHYIKEPGLSLAQVAWLLGYEEAASFNHAFRGWTGRSPSTAREKLLPRHWP